MPLDKKNNNSGIRAKGAFAVVIPAYNHGAMIEAVIMNALKLNLPVIVVDDGSEDGTTGILKKNRRSYLRTIRHKRNMGKTQAILSGAKVAKSDIIVIFDADLQYDPHDIARLVALIDSGFDVATAGNRAIMIRNSCRMSITIGQESCSV